MSYEKELKFAKDIAKDAGELMLRYFRAEDIGTTWKEDKTPVTVADTKINSLVIEHVKKSFPEHGVLGEEESFEPDRDLVWVVDPIDGTIAFHTSIPTSTFLLALVEKSDGQPLVSVTYDPQLDHLYHAIRGQGAYLNNNGIKTSKKSSFANGYVSLYGPPVKTEIIDYWPGRVHDKLRPLGGKSYALMSGGYTASKIASGDFVSLVMGNGSPWDSAASALLVEEAGGVISDLEGNKRRYDEVGVGTVMSANQAIHSQMLDLIKG